MSDDKFMYPSNFPNYLSSSRPLIASSFSSFFQSQFILDDEEEG
jgi:hypothetical protein